MLQIPTSLKSAPEALNSPAAIKAYDDFAAAAVRSRHQACASSTLIIRRVPSFMIRGVRLACLSS